MAVGTVHHQPVHQPVLQDAHRVHDVCPNIHRYKFVPNTHIKIKIYRYLTRLVKIVPVREQTD